METSEGWRKNCEKKIFAPFTIKADQSKISNTYNVEKKSTTFHNESKHEISLIWQSIPSGNWKP